MSRFDVSFRPDRPWPKPRKEECAFYHCVDLPNGETVDNWNWDLRGGFDQYIGHYPLQGKTVLDVGTASGYLAFAAEEAGAARVTAIESKNAEEFERIPFAARQFYQDRLTWVGETERRMKAVKSGFWYTWHAKNSSVEMIYAPVVAFPAWTRSFDVVMAGAIIEHISDPVPFLGSLAHLANDAIIVAFTPVVDTDDLLMRPMSRWENPDDDFTWWELSRGLYRRIFANLGFDISITLASATWQREPGQTFEVVRPTIIATRRKQ